MAVLEYLTANSLISHPFKTRRAGSSNPNPISDDWFYDILFVSYSSTIRSVYISSITKAAGTLTILFNNSESLALVATVVIGSAEVVNHYNNTAKAFFPFSDFYSGGPAPTYAVKIVLGPGLVASTDFTQEYSVAEAELSNTSVIPATPRVDSITFGAYKEGPLNAAGDYDMTNIVSITPTSTVTSLQLKHNLIFQKEATNYGGISVVAGAGAGLYNDCPARDPNVYTINSVGPNPAGALFLNPSTCYTAEQLTQQLKDDLTYDSNGNLLPTLEDYYSFDVYDGNTISNIDVVTPDHSLVFQNFCKPKCSPETMSAFAYYLNRVADGAADLDKIATSKVETRGVGYRIDSTTFGVNPGGFCYDDINNPLTRCLNADPSALDAISCGTKFLKYYHEGRTLEVYHGASDIQRHTIVEVIDDYTVRVSSDPALGAQPNDLFFRVTDAGVISNMNCAASAYNLTSSTYTKPYFQVKYVTSETSLSSGAYVTMVSIVVALFNPSSDLSTLNVTFTRTGLFRQGDIKVRKTGSTTSSTAPTSTVNTVVITSLNCREYAFVEAMYYINCGVSGGILDILVTDNSNNTIGTYQIGPVNGAACPSSLTGTVNKYLVTQTTGTSGDLFEKLELWPAGTTSVSASLLGSTPPNWLIYTPTYTVGSDKAVRLTVNPTLLAAANTSSLYTMSYRITSPGNTDAISQIIIDYVAKPVVLFPLSTSYPIDKPLIVKLSDVYTEQSPLLTVSATNMIKLSSLTDTGPLFVFVSYAIPTGQLSTIGLSINNTTGKITGQLLNSIAKGSVLNLTVRAQNTAGMSATQSIYLKVADDSVPTITLVGGPTYTLNNYTQYSDASPALSFNTTNPPITKYTLSPAANLPAGLAFNAATGKITGKLSYLLPSNGSANLQMTATNSYGTSTATSFTLTWNAILQPPIITSPALSEYKYSIFSLVDLTLDATSDAIAAPLTLTVSGLPLGLSFNSATGSISGTLDPSQYPANYTTIASSFTYPITLNAANLIGASSKVVRLVFNTVALPVIDNAPSVLTLIKGREYTEALPLYKLTASPTADNFIGSPLPPGLTVNSSGAIIGKVLLDATAKVYTSVFNAINSTSTLNLFGTVGYGPTSTIAITVPHNFTSPSTPASYTFKLGAPITSIVFTACGIDAYTYTDFGITGLAPGLNATMGAKASGQPASLTVAGTPITEGFYTITATAPGTGSLGAVSTTATIAVAAAVYSVTGQIKLGAANLAGVTVSYGALASQTTVTAANGYYTLTGLTAGNYNLTVSKDTYLFDVPVRAITVAASNLVGYNFTATGPFRLVSGSIKVGAVPVAGVTVGVVSGANSRTVNTDSLGNYAIYVEPAAATITPASSTYTFTPVNIVLAAGSVALTGRDFAATLIGTLPAPTNLQLTTSNASS